jgi:hypothetical protein
MSIAPSKDFFKIVLPKNWENGNLNSKYNMHKNYIHIILGFKKIPK